MEVFTRLSCLALFSGACLAQSDALSPENGGELFEDRYRNSQPRELTVLASTLVAEEIDRAVLNRLMGEIGSDPESTKRRLELSDSQLEEVFLILSNARGFINGSELANVKAMCSAWRASTAQGEARIEEALAAYREREQRTKTFIAKYHGVVLFDIESTLDDSSKPLLAAYMVDRRRRMANSGATTWGSPVQNISAGTDTIDFHCR